MWKFDLAAFLQPTLIIVCDATRLHLANLIGAYDIVHFKFLGIRVKLNVGKHYPSFSFSRSALKFRPYLGRLKISKVDRIERLCRHAEKVSAQLSLRVVA